MRDLRDFLDGLDGARFVVGVHHADEHRSGQHGPADIVGVHDTVWTRCNIGQLHTRRVQFAARVEHGGMLNLGGDYVLFKRRDLGVDGAQDGEIVGLGSAAGERGIRGVRS